MTMSHKWWEPVDQDVQGPDERALVSIDLSELMSLGMNGWELTYCQYAAFRCSRDDCRRPTSHPFRWIASLLALLWSRTRNAHG